MLQLYVQTSDKAFGSIIFTGYVVCCWTYPFSCFWY